jgi:hypothetical protein
MALHENRLLTLSSWGIEQSRFQRILLAEKLLAGGSDPQKVARSLDWQEFEKFVEDAFEENGFRASKHLIIKLDSKIRREIDILAWNKSLTLAVDCKHWLKSVVFHTRIRRAAEAQAERVFALARRPEILRRRGIDDVENRSILPALLVLGEPEMRETSGVPIVPISKLPDFLTELSPFQRDLRFIPVRSDGQIRLTRAGTLT